MKIFDEIKNNKSLIKFFEDNNIKMTDEVIEKNILDFRDYVLDSEIDCSDVNKPCTRKNNLKLHLENNGSLFYLKEGFCDHFYAEHPYYAVKKYFIYENVNMVDFNVSIKDIQSSMKNHGEEYTKSVGTVIELTKEIINKGSKKGLYLYGEAGVGKTFLLKAFSLRFAKNKKTVIISTLENLLSEFKKNMFDNNSDKEVTIDKCKKVDVLFIDDIGVEKVTKWSRDEALFPILEYRFEHNKMTFFASNYNQKELTMHFSKPDDGPKDKFDTIGGKRIGDRIRGLILSGVQINGKSKR